MLIQFSFSNYKSFRDEAILDLSATKVSEYNNRVTECSGERILPVAAIYGANASGKSNVYSAFECMYSFVIDSLYLADAPDKFASKRPAPFLFDKESANKDTSFEVYFTIPEDPKEVTYNYGFSIGKESVTEEWLNSKAKTARSYKTVFYRSAKDNELDLVGIPKEERKTIERSLRERVLLVSSGAALNVSVCKKIKNWFLCNEFADFGNSITNLVMSHTLPTDFADSKEIQNDVVDFFNSFDESIVGFSVKETAPDKYDVLAHHRMMGSDEIAKIPLEEESSGTLKMFSLYPELKEVLTSGGVYFIDELNARLHPLLVRNFVLCFLNPEINKKHAQLIFTTHDTWQLSSDLFRRDEIWFADKDENGISTLFSLADFVDADGAKIRKDENYAKNYMSGKYSAIPHLRKMM